MIETAVHTRSLPKPTTRVERQAEMRHRLAANSNRRWREKRIAEGKNPNATWFDLLDEAFAEQATRAHDFFGAPSAAYRMGLLR